MKKSILIGLVSIAVLTSTSVQAQITGQTCENLASTIVSQRTTSLSSNELKALEHFGMCKSSAQNSSGSLGILYKAFKLDAKYSQAQRNQLCQMSSSDIGVSNIAVSYTHLTLPTTPYV